MSPELALVAIIAFLWGPTIVWVVYRAIRGRPQGPLDFSGFSPSATPERGTIPGDAALSDLVDREAYWACAGCRSLNRPNLARCYSCGSPRPAASQPDEQVAPVAAPDGSPAGAVLAAAPDTPGNGIGGAAPVVCPYLGVAGGAASSSPGPSPANRCRAGLAATGSRPRLAPVRPAKIALDTQEALCFGPWHGACGRYKAAMTGRPLVTAEPEVALMVAALRAAAEAELPADPVASDSGEPLASPEHPRTPRPRRPSTSTRARPETAPPPSPSPEEPASPPAPRRRRRQG